MGIVEIAAGVFLAIVAFVAVCWLIDLVGALFT